MVRGLPPTYRVYVTCCYHSDAWNMYLSKGQFDLAKQYCKVGVVLLPIVIVAK